MSYTSRYRDPRMDENFLYEESKVQNLMSFLKEMSDANKPAEEVEADKKEEAEAAAGAEVEMDEDEEAAKREAEKDKLDEIFDTFLIDVRERRFRSTKRITRYGTRQGSLHYNDPLNTFTFMQQIDVKPEEREKVQNERVRIAHNFRCYGNDAFHKNDFEKAIKMYTIGIEHVKDSPVLYNNRAAAYIKHHAFQLAIVDTDFIIYKLDERDLMAWLHRGTAYKGLKDDYKFQDSIIYAKRYNTKKIEFIDNFVDKLKRSGF